MLSFSEPLPESGAGQCFRQLAISALVIHHHSRDLRPTGIGGSDATGTACGIIRKPESMSILSSLTTVLNRTRARGT